MLGIYHYLISEIEGQVETIIEIATIEITGGTIQRIRRIAQRQVRALTIHVEAIEGVVLVLVCVTQASGQTHAIIQVPDAMSEDSPVVVFRSIVLDEVPGGACRIRFIGHKD